jgi:hypothetical protein
MLSLLQERLLAPTPIPTRRPADSRAHTPHTLDGLQSGRFKSLEGTRSQQHRAAFGPFYCAPDRARSAPLRSFALLVETDRPAGRVRHSSAIAANRDVCALGDFLAVRTGSANLNSSGSRNRYTTFIWAAPGRSVSLRVRARCVSGLPARQIDSCLWRSSLAVSPAASGRLARRLALRNRLERRSSGRPACAPLSLAARAELLNLARTGTLAQAAAR